LEPALVRRAGLALACQLEQGVGFVGREPGRVRLQDGVVRRRGTHLLEKRTPVLEGAQELGVVHERSTVLPPELLELLRPPGRRDLEHRVGTKAGYHAALPPGFLDRTVMAERVARGIGSGSTSNANRSNRARGRKSGPRRPSMIPAVLPPAVPA